MVLVPSNFDTAEGRYTYPRGRVQDYNSLK